MRDVSVVIPAYQARPFLNQALASIALQTRLPTAVIVVDDGSSDGSGDLAESWKDRLPIEVIRHRKNAGLAQARRTGIARANTELIALLDADDVWLPDHVAAMVAAFDRAGGLVTAKALKWSPGRSVASRPAKAWSLPSPAKQLRRILIMNFVFIGTVFERVAYESMGGFRDGRNGAEDWDLWTRMLLRGLVVTSPALPTVLYRVHEGSMSAGDALLLSELAVLEGLRDEVPHDLKSVVTTSIRHRKSRLALRSAYDYAREGRSTRARHAAFGALGGPAGVRARAVATILLPKSTVRARDTAQAVR